MSNFLEALARRKSVRRFASRKVEDEVIATIIENGTEAPTACNHQLHHFVIVDDQALKEKLQKISGSNDHFLSASHLAVICFQMGWNHNKFAVVQSTAAVAYHSMLAADHLGIGAVWNAGIGNMSEIKTLLGVPPEFQIMGIICFGFADHKQVESKAPRRDVRDVMSKNKFSRHSDHIFPVNIRMNTRYEEIKNHKNKVAVHLPRKWTLKQIINWRAFSVFAKSPTPGIYVSRRFKSEMKSELSGLKGIKSSQRLLEVMPFGGSYTVQIMRDYPTLDITIADLSTNNLLFTQERVRNELGEEPVNLKKVVFNGLSLPFGNESFDYIVVPQIIETLPNYDILLEELWRLVAKDGFVVLSTRNMLSWFGLFYVMKVRTAQVTNFGPYQPLMIPKLKNKIQKRFQVIESFGVSPSSGRIGQVCYGLTSSFCRLWVARLQKRS